MSTFAIPSTAKLVSVSQMQALERQADQAGHSYARMMELAGQAVARAILQPARQVAEGGQWDRAVVQPPKTVLILVGPGNNGGDGLVCARSLREQAPDLTLRLYLWKRRTEPEQDYEGHLAQVKALGIPVVHADQDATLATLRTWLADSDLIVDALLGTGSNRPISGQLAAILAAVRETRNFQLSTLNAQLLAVDCPTGLNCDTGEIDPHTVPADRTITFAHAKWGHYLFPGAEACGEIEVVGIGIPEQVATDSQTFVLSEEMIRPWLPARPRVSHKGSFGKLMGVVGCLRYPGAAYLALAAAGRVGAGLITGAVVREVYQLAAARLSEATWLPQTSEDGFLHPAHVSEISQALAGYSTLLLGCGLGNTPNTRQFIHDLLQALSTLHAPHSTLLLDADALNCLSSLEDWPRRLPANSVMTPHVREMARLCQLSSEEVMATRWELARSKAKAWHVTILLKGPYTVIADPSGNLAVLPIATPALATAGTGDVLAGTIAGLMTQGIDPFPAACLGAWLHGQAGLLCEAEIGRAGVIASDLLARLPITIKSLQRIRTDR